MSISMYSLVKEHSQKYSQIAEYKDDFVRAWINNCENTIELFEHFFTKFSESMLQKDVDLPLAIAMSNYGITQMSSICIVKGLSDEWTRAVILKNYYNLEHSQNIEDMLKHLRLIILRIAELSKPENIPTPVSETVKDCLSYIDKNINTPISMKQISMALGYSSEYLSRKFTEEIKYGLNEFISYKRIEQAKILLLKDNNVNEVAEKMSFSSTGYFIKSFKKITGITPKQYKLWLQRRMDT